MSSAQVEKKSSLLPSGMTPGMSMMKTTKNMLLLRHPFWGILASQLRLVEVEVNHPFFRTAATDGKSVFFNPGFMSVIGEKGRLFVFAHELGHIIFDSMGRLGSRDPRLWNMATDYAINLILVKNEFEMPTAGDIQKALDSMGVPVSSNDFPEPDKVIGLLDYKYDGWSAEKIYEDLKERDSNGEFGSDGYGTLDQHLPGNAPGSGNESGDEKTGGMTSLPKEMDEATKGAWKSRIAQASMQAKSAGKSPSGMERILGNINEPRVDWRQVIASKLTSCKTSDYNWNPPDQDLFGQGITLPVIQQEDCLRAAVVLDASGSVTNEDLRDIMGEVCGVANQFPSYEILMMSFDGSLHNPTLYSDSEGSEVYTYKVCGGGGTLFNAPFAYLAGEEPYDGETCDFKPDVVLFFTDGYPCDGWQEEYSDRFDVVWFITIPDDSVKAPWGVTVKYDRYS